MYLTAARSACLSRSRLSAELTTDDASCISQSQERSGTMPSVADAASVSAPASATSSSFSTSDE